MWAIVVPVIAFMIQSCLAQENIQTRIPNSLVECYQNREIEERDNRLPMNVNILIELIRKIENTPNLNQDIRQIATSIIHRFRVDGIERAPGVFHSSVLPYSPSGFQFSKHRITLSRLIPGNANLFPNGTLTAMERCTLHFMLSSSIETRIRGDEATRCNQLAQFRSMRVPRNINRKQRSVAVKNNYVGDVELLELEDHQKRQRKVKKTGKYQTMEGEEEEEEQPLEEKDLVENEDDYADPSLRNSDAGLVDVASNAISQCPVENGVIRTSWGAVAVGPLISGIAAGLEPQTVTTRDLLALSRSQQGQYRSRQTQVFSVDNRWAATLSGDLAEVSLLQGPVTQQTTVGASGAWNSTTIPRWYFLSQRERLEMTDAEIRGGLDGLILATNIADYRSRAPMLRLSQLIDMYYSQRGVFSSNVRSCDRRTLFTDVAPLEQMQAQTTAFSTVLDREMQLRVTLSSEAIQQFSNGAAAALSAYIPQSLNDLTCAATSIVPNDLTIWRSASQLLIYVDTAWTFREIQPVVAHLLENVDVGPFGTTYTLLNSNDGGIIINTTNSLSDFYMLWNNTNHQLHPSGLSLPNILRTLNEHGRNILNQEQSERSVGGRSLIALIIPQATGVSEADTNFAVERINILREQVPDMLMLFLASGSINRFERFVREPSRDLFPLQISASGQQNVAAGVNPVIQRIQQTPRRIINPRCGANWQSSEWGGDNMNQYVERGGIVFYRVHPNYFFYSGDNRRIRIQGHGYSTISVCQSRWVERPRVNATNQNNVECRQLISDTFEINLSNACDGHFLIQHCPPLFISIEGIVGGVEQSNFRCTDNECRFPDNLRFGIHAENLGCFSGIERLIGTSLTLIIMSLLLVLKI